MFNDLGYSTETGGNGKIGLNKYMKRLDDYKQHLEANNIIKDAIDIIESN